MPGTERPARARPFLRPIIVRPAKIRPGQSDPTLNQVKTRPGESQGRSTHGQVRTRLGKHELALEVPALGQHDQPRLVRVSVGQPGPGHGQSLPSPTKVNARPGQGQASRVQQSPGLARSSRVQSKASWTRLSLPGRTAQSHCLACQSKNHGQARARPGQAYLTSLEP